MSGRVRGAAAIIKQTCLKAHSVHCRAHILNLCVISACNVTGIAHMWVVMKEVCFFFDNSPKRSHHLAEVISSTVPDSNKEKLVSLCKARWIARIDALTTFHDLFAAVVKTQQLISDNDGGIE
eukprot:scpid89151/ scgid20906/ 